MRSVGYNIESAVADVIDNSIAADAQTVDVLVSASGDFQIAILDDGVGMTRAGAIAAMQLAAVSPTAERALGDLGRFGLGLKTASLSQSRQLTLITKSGHETNAFRWSLDHVIEAGSWSLLELDTETELEGLLGWRQLCELHNGTLVHWGDLDQLKMTEGDDQQDLDRVAQRVRDHIALVFHLFNGTDGQRKVSFQMNGVQIEPIDPYMSQSRLTNKTPWESINVDGHQVQLVAYTLPYLSKLSSNDRAKALRLGGLRETQGFYVYRGGRLVIWGNWFRVMPRSEMAKLTRVRVDIPNTLDHLWALDVKKSHAEPPPLVKKRLRELAYTMMMPSRRVQEFRGRKVDRQDGLTHMWQPLVNGEEFSYVINGEHPTIASFTETLSSEQQQAFNRVLEDLQNTFPMVDAHNRLSGDYVPASTEDAELIERAVSGWRLIEGTGMDLDVFINLTSRADPYCLITNFETAFRKAIQQ
jgi:hypothetical protein